VRARKIHIEPQKLCAVEITVRVANHRRNARLNRQSVEIRHRRLSGPALRRQSDGALMKRHALSVLRIGAQIRLIKALGVVVFEHQIRPRNVFRAVPHRRAAVPNVVIEQHRRALPRSDRYAQSLCRRLCGRIVGEELRLSALEIGSQPKQSKGYASNFASMICEGSYDSRQSPHSMILCLRSS